MSMNQQRPGMALILVILTLLALAILGTGAVLLCAEEATIALATEELLRVRLAAESATRSALGTWRTADYRDLAPGATLELATDPAAAPPEVQVHTTVERLHDHLFLLRAEATSAGGIRARAATIVRTIDPLELWRAFPAALTVGGPAESWGEEAVAGYDPGDDSLPAATPAATLTLDFAAEDCLAAALPELVAAFGSVDRPAIAPPPAEPESGSPGPGDPGIRPRLGPLDAAVLRRIADRSDLGSPESHAEPFPLIVISGDLHLRDGTGQGILVVTGDLTMAGKARFRGPILVGGNLRLADQARVDGAVTLAGEAAATLTGESRITYDPCALTRAINGTPLANRAFHPNDRAWIPQF